MQSWLRARSNVTAGKRDVLAVESVLSQDPSGMTCSLLNCMVPGRGVYTELTLPETVDYEVVVLE
jgi:hypothetical protein